MTAKLKRHERVALVKSALSQGEYKPIRDIAEEVGLSVALVASTLRLINEATDDETLTFSPALGWKLAESWDEKRGYVGWLHRHLSTRVDTLSRHVDVSIGLWGDQVPNRLAMCLEMARNALDFAGSFVAPESTEDESVKPKGRVEVIR